METEMYMYPSDLYFQLGMPTLTSGTYGFMAVANAATKRGPYSLQFQSCPLTTLRLGETRNDSLSSSSCSNGRDGTFANWHLLRDSARLIDLVYGFTTPVDPDCESDPPEECVSSGYGDDLLLGPDLVTLENVTGATPVNYSIIFSPGGAD